MSEKFALKWNDYQSNWNKSLQELRNDDDLADVTLLSDDKKIFSAHKILLSSCSSLFKFIFKENKQSNSLLYLGGVNSLNLGFILDYIYRGEVKLYQEHLDSFLESAQRLEILGLLGDASEDPNEQQVDNHFQKDGSESVHEEDKTTYMEDFKNINVPKERVLVRTTNTGLVARSRQEADLPRIDVGDMTPDEIDAKIKSLYQRIDGVWTCLECNKTAVNSSNIRIHVETHIDGLCYTCKICSKEFRSKYNLYDHHKVCKVF